MATARKRSKSKARTGTAGKRKTAQRKAPATKARTKTTGRVKGARGGPAHPEGEERKPTKRASSRRRAAEAGEPIAGKAGHERHKHPPTDITEADVAKIPSLERARARDLGDNAG